MTIPFDKYLVWQCPNCGKWSGKQNNKWTSDMTDQGKAYAISRMTLNCLRCRKSTKLRDNRKGGVRVNHRWCKLPMEATVIIQKMEEYRATGEIQK